MAEPRLRRDSTRSENSHNRPPGIDWSTIGLSGLLGARFLLPTESATEGDTLWLVAVTLFYVAMVSVLRWRAGEKFRRFDRVDYALLALVGAQLFSACVVVMGAGHQRAAINVAWEWLASLMMWFEMRRAIERGRGALLLHTVLTLAIVLAGYGIWQNKVWFRDNAAILNEWDSLHNRAGGLTPEDSYRIRQIEQMLGNDFQASSGGARRMLIDRIRSSTEPIGCFALANSFAGLLVVGLWLALVWARTLKDKVNGYVVPVPAAKLVFSGQRILVGLSGVMLLICLMMTKSRTALLGMFAAAVAVWFIRQTGRWLRRGTIAAITVALSGAALLGVTLMTGIIDAEVISESPKSLRYRLEYWAATSQMILEHPWLGCGPGNFRQNYLHYKLPGASEEILDPHNLLLDVWANAGIVAWAGLMASLIWGVRAGWKATQLATQPLPSETFTRRQIRGEGVLAAAAGPGLVILQQLIFGVDVEVRLWLFLVAAMLWGAWSMVTNERRVQPLVWGAWVSLSIHLCGAGGIAMPALFHVWALLLATLVTATSPRNELTAIMEPPRRCFTSLIVGIAAMIAAITCIQTALVPNTLCKALIADAMGTMSRSGRADRAEQQLLAAANADPLSPEPWILLMQLRAKGESETALERATEAGRKAISRNPDNPLTYELLGLIWNAAEPATAVTRSSAIEWLTEAGRRYPHSSRIHSTLAIAFDAAGRSTEARRTAAQAIRLDDLNRAAGHVDKVLTDGDRSKLEQIASTSDTSAPESR